MNTPPSIPTKKLRLTTHLSKLLLNSFTLVWLVIAPLTYLLLLKEVDEIFNHQLVHLANNYNTLKTSELIRLIDNNDQQYKRQTEEDEDDNFAIFIWDEKGKLLKASKEHPNFQFSVKSPTLIDIDNNGRWRIVWLSDSQDERFIGLARKLTERDEIASQLALGLLLPWIIFLLATIVIVALGIKKGLAPLQILTDQLTKRSPSDLTPIQQSELIELQPVIRQINHLFTEVESVRANEQAFTANAAHELRTPLAALQIQIETVRKTPPTDKDLANIHQSVLRMGKLIEQLLLLAKLDEKNLDHIFQTINLYDTLWQSIAEQTAAALDKKIDLTLETQTSNMPITANPSWLKILWENLLKNAIAHTPNGGNITISTIETQTSWQIFITDSGSGVEKHELNALGKRFWRSENNNNIGSGLGLSICKKIVEIHGGKIEFSNNTVNSPAAKDKGLTAMIELPRLSPSEIFHDIKPMHSGFQ